MSKLIRFTLVFGWAWLIWQLTTTPDFKVSQDSVISFIISSGGHVTFFGVLAILLRFTHLSTMYSILLTSLYGLLIELVQRNIPGRSGDPLDWLLDTLGAVIFLVIMNKLAAKKLESIS